MDYATCREALERAEADVSASEFHGALCAMLCTRSPVRLERWIEEIVVTDASHEALGWGRTLVEAGESTQRAFEHGECGLQLLLPDDERPLAERGQALSDWCAGFLFGLGLAGERTSEALSDDAREVVADLTEFTRIDTDEPGSEGAESAYAEIIEYVRVGVLLIYEELARGGASRPGNSRLH